MFSQLQFVRLRSAEKALKEGRIDEAYRLATAPDLRGHPRAAAVLASLSQAFFERARAHYRANRFSEALLDLERAEASGGPVDPIRELRSHVQTVMGEVHREQASRRERVEAARRRIENGSLAAGRKILEQASGSDHAARDLHRKAIARTERARDMLQQARRYLEAGRLDEAIRRLKKVRLLDAHDPSLGELELQLCEHVLAAARQYLFEGRLKRCGEELAWIRELGATRPENRELEQALSVAHDAAQCLGELDFAGARRHVMTLARLVPGAEWTRIAMEQIRQLDELYTSLTSGPLGETVRPVERAAALRPRDLQETVMLASPPAAKHGGLPERLLLLVDGGGSYLLLRGSRASVGRAAAAKPADVPLFSDLAERHAEIIRMDEDYFLTGAREVEIAGKLVRHHLLQDGDRIVLGRRGKVTFRLPSRRSSTAVLDLSDTTKMPHDVRRVLLFHQHATIGAGPDTHIRCHHAGTPLVLFERDKALWVRCRNDGHVDTKAHPLVLGEPCEVSGISMVLREWEVDPSGAKGL